LETTAVYVNQQQSWTTMYIVTGYQVMLWVTMTSVPTADSEWRIEMLHLNDTLKRFCMASAAPGAPAVATASTKWPSSVDNAKDLADRMPRPTKPNLRFNASIINNTCQAVD
jgi:hypothetical protein